MQQKSSRSKDIGALALVVFAVIYLLNPGFGVFEIIPDNIPGIGNLDEAGAVVLLWRCLAYLMGRVRSRRNKL